MIVCKYDILVRRNQVMSQEINSCHKKSCLVIRNHFFKHQKKNPLEINDFVYHPGDNDLILLKKTADKLYIKAHSL